MKQIPVIDAAGVEELLPSGECVKLMRDTIAAENRGDCVQYLRTVIPMPNKNIMAAMPAYFNDGYFGMKILSVYPKNYMQKLPSHQGEIIVYDEPTGSVAGIVDAMSVTGVRTGACSAVATDLLARRDAGILCLIGCGHQGWSHLNAIITVRKLTEVRVYDELQDKAQQFAEEASAKYGIPVKACTSAEEAVRGADIICTLTISAVPVIKKEWVSPGAHINAVGACTPTARELPSDLVQCAKFYGDSIESVINESGDYLFAVYEGMITSEHLLGTIGDLLNEKITGRTDDTEITIFESLGMACEDLAAAHYILAKEASR